MRLLAPNHGFVGADSSVKPRLTRTERALLRVLFSQGGACEDGHVALAAALDCGERSTQRAARALCAAGLITIARRGRGHTARFALTASGSACAAQFVDRAAATQEKTTPAAPAAVTVPAGFTGDARALNVARITVRISHDDSPAALARAYVAQIDGTPELARITAFLDELGTLPTFSSPTGLPMLDEGLRAYFASLARRARTREYMRNLARGVKVLDHDEV